MANEAKGAMAADPQAITLLVQQPNNNRPQVLPPGILITTRRKAPTAGQSSAAKRARARAAREQSRARGTGRRGLSLITDRNSSQSARKPNRFYRYDVLESSLLLLLFNTTRTTSGPPSTGAAIAMDGGVAAAAAVQHNAHNLRTPLSLWTEAWPTHNLLLHRPLVGGGSRGGGAAAAAAVQHNAHNLRTPKHGSRYRPIAMDGGVADTQPAITQAVSRRRCCCCSTQRARARTHSGPPSTGATITMDGGVADTTSCCSTHGGPAVAHYGCTGSAPRLLYIFQRSTQVELWNSRPSASSVK